MDLAVITAQQVAELFILIGLGALGAKTGLLRPEGKQTLSNLLVNLVVPAMIINSYRMEFSAEILHNLMAAFALSTLSILLGLIITLLFKARYLISLCKHVHGPQQGQPDAHLPVRLCFLQCGLYGSAPHFGALRLRGPALCQRLLYHVQSPALDGGLQHGQRQL